MKALQKSHTQTSKAEFNKQEMTNEKIKYTRKSTAVSSKAVRAGETHKLSALDRLMEAHHIRAVYLYKTPRMKAGEITKMMRESLGETLNHFPAICGRLVRDERGDWEVKCNDAGVRLVEAKAKGRVEDWFEKENQILLAHWEDMFHVPYCWSTFYVQLTEFEEGGLAVGLSCSHLLADPITVSSFIKAWAHINLHNKILGPPFFHPLPPRRLLDPGPTTRPNTHLINHYNSILQNSGPVSAQTYKTITLLFSDPMVQACIDMAQYGPNQSKPGPFQSLTGLLWAAISRVKGRAHNDLVDMSICSDVRRALRLDKGFFGNCMIYTKVFGEGLDGTNMSHVAKVVGEAIDGIDSGEVKDLIEWLERDEVREKFSLSRIDGGDLVVCMNLEEMDLYWFQFDSRFECVRASYYVEPLLGSGRVLVLPSPPEEGRLSRLVTVSLPGDEVLKLCEDNVISSFSPSILTNLF